MKNTNFKNALIGIAHTLVASYLFFLVFFSVILGTRGQILLIPLLGFLYTFWIIIPLGVALGMLIPRIAYGKTRLMAALQGAGLGAISGLLSLLCLDSVYDIGLIEAIIVFPAMGYCALWVSAYACYRAKGQSLYK